MAQISVIVPVYKVEKYINRCVDSILLQTFVDFELILIDDGSPDDCGKICDKYALSDSRIHVIHKENGGLSDARNAGIDWAFANSDSEWIAFIDSDDWIHPNYLEILFEGAVENKVSLSMCRFNETDIENNCTQIEKASLSTPKEGFFPLGKKITAHAWGKLYEKELFREIRYPYGKLYEDMFTTHKILFSLSQIAITESKLYNYFVNPDSIVRSHWSYRQLDQIEAYEVDLLPFFKSYSQELYSIVKSQYIKALLDQYKWAKDDGEIKAANEIKKKCMKAIIHYKGLKVFPVNENSWRYENVFPKIMNAYWFYKSRLKKR